jgi:hypothetical protein
MQASDGGTKSGSSGYLAARRQFGSPQWSLSSPPIHPPLRVAILLTVSQRSAMSAS